MTDETTLAEIQEELRELQQEVWVLTRGDNWLKNVKTQSLAVGVSAGTILQDKDADTKVQVEKSADEDKLRIDTGGTERMVVDASGIDLTGSITVSGTVDGVDIAARDHAEAHSVASHNDTTATGTELETLTDGSDADSLHIHTIIQDADSDTKVQVEESADEDIIRFDSAGTEVMIIGADGVDIFHTAAAADEHAVELDVDAAGHGDVKALDVAYITGAIAAGEDEGILLINIDEIAAGGGDVFGLEVLATSGGADAIYAVKAGAVVGVILQESGTFANPNTATNDTPTTNVADMKDGSDGTNTTIFTADDDYIIIGATNPFTEIEFIIETPASNPGIKPTFEYSKAAGAWAAFSPVDGTNGFRNTGVVAWDAADLTDHAVHTSGGVPGDTYDIKITRTHAVAGSVSLFYAKTAATVVYSWDESGNVTINSLSTDTISEKTADAGVTIEGNVHIDSEIRIGGDSDKKIAKSATQLLIWGDLTVQSYIEYLESSDEWFIGIATNDIVRVDSAGLDVNVINEFTNATGVTIDTVLIKDGAVDGLDCSGVAAGADVTGDNPPQAHGISVHTGHANWKVLYTDASGDEQEIALGADGEVFTSTGAAGVPAFEAAAGGGAVATDVIWDAAGDLAVGTGADTAARLAIGAAHSIPWSDGAAISWQTAPELQYIKDTGGTTRITTAASQYHITLTGQVSVNPTAGGAENCIYIAPSTTGVTQWVGVYVNPTLTYTGNNRAAYAIFGQVAANAGAGETGQKIAALNFTTLAKADQVTATYASNHGIYTKSQSTSTATTGDSVVNITAAYGLEAFVAISTVNINFDATVNVTDAYGIKVTAPFRSITDIGTGSGTADITNYYGIAVEDHTFGSPTKNYLLEVGGTIGTAPYLRVAGGANPGAGDTNLYLLVEDTLMQVWSDGGTLKVK